MYSVQFTFAGRMPINKFATLEEAFENAAHILDRWSTIPYVLIYFPNGKLYKITDEDKKAAIPG